jgi:hypothetical protein
VTTFFVVRTRNKLWSPAAAISNSNELTLVMLGTTLRSA